MEEFDNNLSILGESILNKTNYNFKCKFNNEKVETVRIYKKPIILCLALISVITLTSTVLAFPAIYGFFNQLFNPHLLTAEMHDKTDKPMIKSEDMGIQIEIVNALAGLDRSIVTLNYKGLSKKNNR